MLYRPKNARNQIKKPRTVCYRIYYYITMKWKTKLTVQTMNVASIFKQPLSQHNHRIRYGRCSFAIVQTFVTVQYKCTLFVRVGDLFSEISTLDCRRQVNFSGGEPSQHDGGYAEVNGVADVTIGKVHGAATVEYKHPALVTRRQFGGQPVAANANVRQQGRIIFSGHSERLVGRYRQDDHVGFKFASVFTGIIYFLPTATNV